ncbi:MAG: Gx transporter family protein [Coriobacteriia bacterium]|jgi:heptaprenyl diphosphate synthase|nr:Gx transporter family protein [Coriobacteriia bacterium]
MLSRDRRWRATDLVGVALLLALAAVIGYVEGTLVAPLPVPGLRLGLANVAVIIALARFGPRAAAFVSLGRVFLVALAAGTLAGPTFLLSLAGACASLVVMIALASAGPMFSVIGWSLAGSAVHVIAQLCVASLLAATSAPLALVPVALALSVPLGYAVGFLARLLLSRIPDWSLSAAGR